MWTHTFSRVCSTTYNGPDLSKMHQQHGHSRITRLVHFVRTKNLPFSIDDVKRVCFTLKVCAELELRFFQKPLETSIKAMRPWERIFIDFKGPLEVENSYLFFVIDEFSRYPFAFPCQDMTTATVIQCLSHLFSLFSLPLYVHSNSGISFMSKELKHYLSNRALATSRSSPYHPTDNSQAERMNQPVWRTVEMILCNYKQPNSA